MLDRGSAPVMTYACTFCQQPGLVSRRKSNAASRLR